MWSDHMTILWFDYLLDHFWRPCTIQAKLQQESESSIYIFSFFLHDEIPLGAWKHLTHLFEADERVSVLGEKGEKMLCHSLKKIPNFSSKILQLTYWTRMLLPFLQSGLTMTEQFHPPLSLRQQFFSKSKEPSWVVSPGLPHVVEPNWTVCVEKRKRQKWHLLRQK